MEDVLDSLVCHSKSEVLPVIRRRYWWVLIIALALGVRSNAWAQQTHLGDVASQESLSAALSTQPTSSPAHDEGESTNRRKPYHSQAYGARLETEPPGYVKPMNVHGETYGIEALKELDWLDFGLEQRTRFELRDDYYFRGAVENHDEQFLLRSRVYLGVRQIFDPFRFAIEFQDARQFMSRFPEDNRDVDEADFLQAYGELCFTDALRAGYPLRFRAGRMSFDLIDRKIIGRNRWRNTTNAFDGFRLQLGEPSCDWQFDAIAVMPVERRMRQADRSDEERWFYGLVAAWRGWSEIVILEPYYFVLDEDRKDPTRADREIHTFGLRAFGPMGETGFDRDVDVAFQSGEDGPRRHRAFAAYGELGYTFAHVWKPRLSVSGTYGSGDRDPDDNTSERFDRLFAPNHFRSTSDLFNWQNVISPKLRVDFRPQEKLRIDAAYGGYWLASDRDAWVTPGRRDPLGRSGDFVGQEFELRARHQLHDHTKLEAGYSHFIPGAFVRNTGPADDSDFFYITVTFTF